MKSIDGDVVLITGASSGIGKALAGYLSQKGYKVYGTSRKQTSNDQATVKTDGNSGFLKMIRLDVCSDESVTKAVNLVLETEGKIDILINNAGSGIAGAVEDTTAAEALTQFEVTFFGVLRMCREVLPGMRRQGKGLIINIGSVAGLFAIPFQSMYSASKYALEAMTEALRMETKPLGIRVVLVEPGDTKTGFTEKRQYVAAARDSIYWERCSKSVRNMAQSEQKAPEPKAILTVVERMINQKNPPVRVVVGFDYKLMAFAKRLAPARVIEYIVPKMY
jgi:short-subunit dehydrogenase